MVRLQVLQARLAGVERRLGTGSVRVVRGGRALLRKRGNLAAAGLTQAQWRAEWEAARLFLTADGEKDKPLGNETIRWHPGEGWLEIRLPAPLAHLANRPHGRYRLSAPAGFSYRGGEVAAQAATGAIRYDISCDPVRGRWYLDASWKAAPAPAPCLAELRAHPVLAVDLNHGHLAAWAVTPDGNPAGPPVTVSLALSGLPASQRDGRLRAAISELTRLARQRGCRAIVIEDLDFADAREQGRERHGSRPSRGRAAAATVRWSPASRPRGSGTGWSRWPPTRAWRSSPSTRLTPPAGRPSTGSARCGNEFPRSPPAATTRPRW